MEKDAKVVMLPTNEKANIILDRGILEYIPNAQIADTINSIVKGYHLYITSDDEIKVGDWVLDIINNKILKADHDVDYEQNHVFKIIATTDNSLKLSKFSHYSQDLMKVAVYKDYILPQPSQSFIEIYVEEYNKGNVITDVLVEYESIVKSAGGNWEEAQLMYSKPKVNPKDNTITIKK